MKHLVKRLISSVAITSLLLVPMLMPAVAHAQSTNDPITGSLNCGANLTVGSNCQIDSGDAGAKLDSIITLVINIFSLVVGVVAVIMIIIGGLKYITSGGDSGNITGAKNTILYAVIGLVIVALAQFIVRFVLSKVAGTTGTGG